MGQLVSMTNGVERHRTPLNDKLHEYFIQQCPNYHGVFEAEEGDRVLENINDYLSEAGIEMGPLDYPQGGGTDVYLVPIGHNLLLKVLVADEYFGDGEYSKYVEICSFVINKHTSLYDVSKLVEFVRKYLCVSHEC